MGIEPAAPEAERAPRAGAQLAPLAPAHTPDAASAAFTPASALDAALAPTPDAASASASASAPTPDAASAAASTPASALDAALAPTPDAASAAAATPASAPDAASASASTPASAPDAALAPTPDAASASASASDAASAPDAAPAPEASPASGPVRAADPAPEPALEALFAPGDSPGFAPADPARAPASALASSPAPAAIGRADSQTGGPSGRTAAPVVGPARAVCLAEYEVLAAGVLPGAVRDFISGGSGAELTLRGNRSALDRVRVTPRVMGGVEGADPSGRLVGTRAAMPVAVAPMAYQRLVHPEGELELARAAAAAGVPYVISTLSSYPMEKIPGECWFQLYWLRDRGQVERLVDRAAGCSALVVTVDVPVMGRRLRDVRNEFALPDDVVAANLETTRQAHAAVPGLSAVAAHTASAFSPTVSWEDLEWLKRRADLPLVVKGILDPRDARRAVEIGASAVVVSNHGGRQLDGAIASIDALPAVVDAVGNDIEVLMDSGIRSGTDVLKALAVGAHGVLVGRPLLWALAVDACDEAFRLLRTELTDAMLLAGCADLAAVKDLTWRNDG